MAAITLVADGRIAVAGDLLFDDAVAARDAGRNYITIASEYLGQDA